MRSVAVNRAMKLRTRPSNFPLIATAYPGSHAGEGDIDIEARALVNPIGDQKGQGNQMFVDESQRLDQMI